MAKWLPLVVVLALLVGVPLLVVWAVAGWPPTPGQRDLLLLLGAVALLLGLIYVASVLLGRER